jgi:sugar/nucleoside kinase (ribokinase family)
MNTKPLDLITMGRSSIDLYSNQVGTRFEDISSFNAYVGGSPTNIAVGTRRLGLEVGLLTAVGTDRTGDFVLNFLEQEGFDLTLIPRKPGHPTSAAVLGIEAHHKTPLVFYREHCADVELNIDDVIAANLSRASALEFAGTNLAKEPARSATFYAVERAKALGKKVFMDIDFRANQWHDPRAFGVAVRAILPMVDVAIGTEEEINAVGLTSSDQLKIVNSQIQFCLEDQRHWWSKRVRRALKCICNLVKSLPRQVFKSRCITPSALAMPSVAVLFTDNCKAGIGLRACGSAMLAAQLSSRATPAPTPCRPCLKFSSWSTPKAVGDF